MKLHPDGTVEGTPEEIAAYAKALGITPQLSPCVSPCPLPCPTKKDEDPTEAPSIPWKLPKYPLPYTLETHGPRIYADTCGCNPRNGGNGVCGCVIGNKPLGGGPGLGEVWCETKANSTTVTENGYTSPPTGHASPALT